MRNNANVCIYNTYIITKSKNVCKERENRSENFNITGIIWGWNLVLTRESNDKQSFVMIYSNTLENHIALLPAFLKV